MTVESFDDGVDGYHDVADQLRSYLLSRAGDALEQNCAGNCERVREAFLEAVGGLPERPEPLPVDHAGTVDREGYTVERLVFEVRPNYHVTANCYVPAGEGPHPAVLLYAGHHPFPKVDPENQRACIDLATNGVVALCFDPPGVGEREQYPDAAADPDAVDAADGLDEGVHPVFHGSGVYAHSLAGQQANYAGGNVARWFVHEALCALDYLESRGDVDASRLGVTGTSGGGMLAVYVGLVDDRPVARAPCCWVCEREHSMRAGFPVDHEQVLHGAIPGGFDVTDLARALAPTPLCVGAARSDFFPIEGVHDAFERVERAYAARDAADACELRVADTGHAAVREIPGVLDFLTAELADRNFEPTCDDDPVESLDDHEYLLDRDRLQCTPTGSVRETYADERTLTDLVADELVDSESGEAAVDADAIGERVRDRLGVDRDHPLHPRTVATDEHDGLAVERVFWKSEYDPDVVVAGVLVADSEQGSRTGGDREVSAPAVVLFEDGTAELPERSDELAALAREHGTALAVDPRGVGATCQRPTPATWGDPDYDGVYGTTHALAAHAALLGDSLFGMRVHDALTAVRFLRDRTGASTVSVLGDGIGAYHALYAAAAAPDDAASVTHLGDSPLRSFRERATTADAGFDPRLDCHDVLDCDVPDVVDALRTHGVHVRVPGY
jgi:dienelactone hydrolase